MEDNYVSHAATFIDDRTFVFIDSMELWPLRHRAKKEWSGNKYLSQFIQTITTEKLASSFIYVGVYLIGWAQPTFQNQDNQISELFGMVFSLAENFSEPLIYIQ